MLKERGEKKKKRQIIGYAGGIQPSSNLFSRERKEHWGTRRKKERRKRREKRGKRGWGGKSAKPYLFLYQKKEGEED